MATSSGSIVPLIGRILLSSVFIIAGAGKIAGFSGEEMFVASKHLPLPAVALGIAMLVELLGGLAILVGLYTRFAAWIVFLYLIPTTLIFHNFWAMQGPAHQDNMLHFEKNVAIMGGLLILATFGAGAFSVDAARAPKSA
ncbi:MAG TPA: DoxX family protein [Candidatus Acidoferrales bacterium]|jgi:putative oxidoreductase|nr:DoxX family protein [Candidatus Acidoferrales bacterium]